MVGPVSLPLAASDSIVEKPVLGSPLLDSIYEASLCPA